MTHPSLGLILRITVTASIIAFFAFKLDWLALIAEFNALNTLYIGVAVVLAGVTHVLGGLRWWYLLKVQSIEVSAPYALRLTFTAQFFNLFLLGSIGGDAAKLIYLARLAPTQKTHAAVSTIMDRLMGLVVMLVSALLAGFFQYGIMTHNDSLRSAASYLIVVLIILLGGTCSLLVIPEDIFERIFPNLWKRFPKRHLIALTLQGFKQHGVALLDTLIALAISVAAWIATGFVGLLLAKSMSLDATYPTILIILSLVTFVAILPISIGGHGVREGAFVVLFGFFIGQESMTASSLLQSQAIIYSILFFISFSCWGILGGIMYLLGSDKPIHISDIE